MKKQYIINDYKRFTTIFKNENVEENKIQEILNMLDTKLNIIVEIDNNRGYDREFIFDGITKELKNYSKDFNSYEKSLISSCYSHFKGIDNALDAGIEVINIA